MLCMSGDLSQVSKNGNFTEEEARKAWAAIFNEHTKKHGLPEAYLQYIAKMQKALQCYAEAYTGKRWKLIKAKLYKAEAESLTGAEGERIEITCARISKFIGFPVRANVCTASEFYDYLALMKGSL
jgi:hypothetical protein